MTGTKKIIFENVIGSWGKYNACNDRALGSKWLTLNDFESWEEIEEELKKEGFKLNGIDEELFIQDYEADFKIPNCDHTHPQKLFEILKASGILEDEKLYKKALAFVDAYSFEDFCERVEKDGEYWGDDYDLFEGDLYQYDYELAHCQEIPSWLESFIDYKKYGQDDILNGHATETSYGILRG